MKTELTFSSAHGQMVRVVYRQDGSISCDCGDAGVDMLSDGTMKLRGTSISYEIFQTYDDSDH